MNLGGYKHSVPSSHEATIETASQVLIYGPGTVMGTLHLLSHVTSTRTL